MSHDESRSEFSGTVVETSCARETIQRLLSDLDGCLPKGVFPSESIWIIVSSSTVRRELIRAILAHRGTTLGIVIHTLRSASLTILQRVHESLPEANAFTEILIQREAQKEAVLHKTLSVFEDGFGVVNESVMDLLDAGIAPNQEDALIECLSTLPQGVRRDRALSLVNVALRVHDELRARGTTTGSGLAEHAARWVEQHREQALDCNHVFVVGFGDTNGQGGDFLSALMRQANTRIYIELPDDPATPGTLDPGERGFVGRDPNTPIRSFSDGLLRRIRCRRRNP